MNSIKTADARMSAAGQFMQARDNSEHLRMPVDQKSFRDLIKPQAKPEAMTCYGGVDRFGKFCFKAASGDV